MPFPGITIPPETDHRSLTDKLSRFFNAAQKYWLAASKNQLPYYSQASEPALMINSVALWKDTDGGPAYYLVANFNGTQKKVALT